MPITLAHTPRSHRDKTPEWLQGADCEGHVTVSERGGVIWHGGTWRGGIWRGGIWEGGTWKGGVWAGGAWHDMSILDNVVAGLPELLTAGGRSIEQVARAWGSHEWGTCPMSVAFDIDDPRDIPQRWRLRAAQFVCVYDMELLKSPGAQRGRSPGAQRGRNPLGDEA
jgi:hypothetical protein